MVDHILKHWEDSWKYAAPRSICAGNVVQPCFDQCFDIIVLSQLKLELHVRRKQRNKMVKTYVNYNQKSKLSQSRFEFQKSFAPKLATFSHSSALKKSQHKLLMALQLNYSFAGLFHCFKGDTWLCSRLVPGCQRQPTFAFECLENQTFFI